jgi:hypothetical protein
MTAQVAVIPFRRLLRSRRCAATQRIAPHRAIAITDRRGVLVKASKLMVAAVVSWFVLGACAGSGATPTSSPAATTAGGAATPAPAAQHPDSCTLLTAADIKTATGTAWGPGVADGYGHCNWYAGTSTVDEGNGGVSLWFASGGTTLASVRSGPAAGGVDLTVSGHPAYWSGGEFSGMWVDLGTSVLVLTINPVPVGGQAMVQHMAELAVAKL